MTINRILTPEIIAVLFNLKSEVEVLEGTNTIMELLTDTQKILAKDFLIERGVSAEEVEAFMEDENAQNEQIQQLLASEEMQSRYFEAYNAVVEAIYSQQLSSMDDERKARLDELVALEQKKLQTTDNALKFQEEVVKYISQLRNSGQVTQEQIEEALGKAYDEIPVETEKTEVITEATPETTTQANPAVDTGLPPLPDQPSVDQSGPTDNPVPTEPQTPPQPVENP